MTPVDINKLKELLAKATLWKRRIASYTQDEREAQRSADEALQRYDTYLPALIAKAERVDALEAALRKHGKHDGLCARIGGYGYCSCGLEAELDALSPKSASPDAPKRPGFQDA